jgi:hypothetical protein
VQQRYLGNAGDLPYGNSITALERLKSLSQSLRNMQTIKFGHGKISCFLLATLTQRYLVNAK